MNVSVEKKFVILIVIVAMAFGGGFYAVHELSKSKPLRVGYLPIYVDLPFFVALEEGLFEKRGLAIEPIRRQSSPQLADGIVAGRFDAAASIAVSNALITEDLDPGQFKIFLVDEETPENYLSSLVVRGDNSVSDIEDLIGKEIAFFPGPTAGTFGRLALNALGLPADSYQAIPLSIEKHIDALLTNAVDALVTYEPVATQAVMKDGAVKLFPGLVETHVISPWQAGVWIVSQDAFDSRRGEMIRFIEAIYEAVDLIREDPTYSKRALTPYTPIDPDVAVQTPNIPFAKIDEADVATLQRHAHILFEEGVLSKEIQVYPLILPPNFYQ